MRWISDPSHGWLEVTFKDLAAVGVAIDDFSFSAVICIRVIARCIWRKIATR